MKIAVYTVALNEEKHVERWYASTSEADIHLIGDTGSTDQTVKAAKKLGVTVAHLRVKPWRFDDSRNALLALLPEDVDYCISLDMDEVLAPGWRKGLEAALAEGIQWPRYDYVFAWHDDGTPRIEFKGIKIHPRLGVRWRFPIHEIPESCVGQDFTHGNAAVTMHHFPDNEKSRGKYLDMLKDAVAEDPRSPRLAYYLARDYYFAGHYTEAASEFLRYLALPDYYFPAEYCEAYRYLAKMQPENAEYWLIQAIRQDSGRREPLVDLAQHYSDTRAWRASLELALKALDIAAPPAGFLQDSRAWGAQPHDLVALAAYNLNLFELAVEHGQLALNFEPSNERLLKNMTYYIAKLDESPIALRA